MFGHPPKGDQKGWTALHLAAGRGHAAIVRLLLGHPKTNAGATTNGGLTPLREEEWKQFWAMLWISKLKNVHEFYHLVGLVQIKE